LFGDNRNSLASSIQPALTEVASAAQLGQALLSTVTAGQQGDEVAAISGITIANEIGTAASVGRAGQAALNAIDAENIFGGV
jgi:hypothetical protein